MDRKLFEGDDDDGDILLWSPSVAEEHDESSVST